MCPGGFRYTVELTATSPPAEDKLSVEAMVRQGVSVKIALGNPLQQVRVGFGVGVGSDRGHCR